MIGSILGRAINMLTNIILARWLTPTGYGEYSLFLTYVVLFSAIASLGMQFITNKYVARNQNESRKYLYLSFFWRLIGYIFAFVSVLLFYEISLSGFKQAILYALLIGVFLDSLWSGLQSIAFGMQRMEWNSIIDVVISVITFLLYYGIQCYNSSLLTVENVIVIYLVLYLLKNIAYYFSLHYSHLITGYYKISNIKIKDLKIFFTEGFPFYILVIMALFTNQFPIIFLEKNSGIEEVAYFNTANKLLLPMTILLSTALTALFPNQAKLFSKDKKRYWEQCKKMLDYLIIIGCTISLFISIFRNGLVNLLYGDAYKNTGNVMAFQCWYFLMFSIVSFNGNILGASDRQKLLSAESVLYAITTTPILYYGSFFGAQGLSIAYAIACFINITYIFIILYNASNKSLSLKTISKYIIILGSFVFGTFILTYK